MINSINTLTGIPVSKIQKIGSHNLLSQRKEFELTPSQKNKLNSLKDLILEYNETLFVNEDVIIDSSTQAGEYCKNFLKNEKVEHFYLLSLDSKNKIIACDKIHTGTVNQSVIYPREVVKKALENEAVSVIFAHNHPSGTRTPSQADKNLTDKLVKTFKEIQINVVDHIIIAHDNHYSFAEMGNL
jgi:DNA repair protein RadC